MIPEPLLSVGDLWLLLIAGLAFLVVATIASGVVEARRARAARRPAGELVHACPPEGSAVTPCCHRTLLELPRTERVTLYGPLVTCGGAR